MQENQPNHYQRTPSPERDAKRRGLLIAVVAYLAFCLLNRFFSAVSLRVYVVYVLNENSSGIVQLLFAAVAAVLTTLAASKLLHITPRKMGWGLPRPPLAPFLLTLLPVALLIFTAFLQKNEGLDESASILAFLYGPTHWISLFLYVLASAVAIEALRALMLHALGPAWGKWRSVLLAAAIILLLDQLITLVSSFGYGLSWFSSGYFLIQLLTFVSAMALGLLFVTCRSIWPGALLLFVERATASLPFGIYQDVGMIAMHIGAMLLALLATALWARRKRTSDQTASVAEGSGEDISF